MTHFGGPERQRVGGWCALQIPPPEGEQRDGPHGECVAEAVEREERRVVVRDRLDPALTGVGEADEIEELGSLRRALGDPESR